LENGYAKYLRHNGDQSPEGSFRFSIGCFISKPERVDRYRKWRQTFALFDSQKNLGERWANLLSEFYQFNLGPNLLYTSAASQLRGLGQGLSNG